MTDEQIVEHILVEKSEDFPADPSREDTWHLSDADLRQMLLKAMEMAGEHSARENQMLKPALTGAIRQRDEALVMIERALATRIDDQWLKEARELLCRLPRC